MSSNSKSSFFRQGGWMVVSTFLGGIFMVLVQRVAKSHLPKSEFVTFNALLRLLIVFGGVPAAALQTMFAQQSAAAVDQEKSEALAATARALLRTTFFLWLIIAGLTVVFAGPLCRLLGPNPAGLLLTVTIVLSVLWIPVLKGLLQGLHRFTSLGWLQILEGGGRFFTMQLVVLLLAASATGGVFAVFAGQYVTLAIAIWLTRDVWSAKSPARFSWKQWLVLGGPLTLGMGSLVFMQSIDTLFVRGLFFNVEAVGFYVNAMLTGYAIIMFIAPITNVMFPRLVRSLALSEKSDALTLTVVITGAFACLAAIGCTLFPQLPLMVIFSGKVGGAQLVPWFAWSLLPLTMANVLVQNLLARRRFAAAPWLILVPILYGLALMLQAPHLVKMAQREDLAAMTRVIQTLGCSCLALFGVAAWFTWRQPSNEALDRGSAAAR